jgi:hypothetical protein
VKSSVTSAKLSEKHPRIGEWLSFVNFQDISEEAPRKARTMGIQPVAFEIGHSGPNFRPVAVDAITINQAIHGLPEARKLNNVPISIMNQERSRKSKLDSTLDEDLTVNKLRRSLGFNAHFDFFMG